MAQLKTKSSSLLDKGLNTLHEESKNWLEKILAWKHTVEMDGVERQKAASAASAFLAEAGKLQRGIDQHKYALFQLLKKEKPDEEAYREQHRHFADSLAGLEKQFEQLAGAGAQHASETLYMIYERRAVRKYKSKAVDKKMIEAIIDAGRMAPSAINLQPWKFYVLSHAEQVQHFAQPIAKAAEPFFHLAHEVKLPKSTDPIFHHAPVVVFLVAKREDDWAALDIGLCAQNMMLAARTMGLDTCPVGLARLIGQTPVYKELGLDPGDQVYLALTIGYGDESPKPHERKKDNVFYL